jgi:soluble lytic murein transglycosylase-like protein
MISFSSAARFEKEMSGIRKSTFALDELAAYVDIDSSKQQAIRKVLTIICQYNDGMQDDLKLAIANEIFRMSVKYENLDIDLICATITHESARTWEPTVVSHAGALGLMQIMPYTGYFLSKHEGVPWTNARQVLFDPVNNIRMGCRYLSRLIELYSVDGGLAAYNGGPRRAAMWLASGRNDQVLFEETRTYVPAVLKLYDTFKN